MSTVMPGLKSPNPEVQTDLFESQNGHNFWIGRIATLDTIQQPGILDGISRLRGGVYLKLGYVTPEQIDSSGRESDEDDARAIHFAVLEKPLSANGNGHANVIGTSRLIVKDSPDSPLPIEHYFPEVFESDPAGVGTVEVSRLIANHENDRIQHKVALGLIRAMTHYSMRNNIEADYCMVEAPLVRLLNASGVPTEILSEAKDIPDYGGVLLPVKIEARKVIQNVVSKDVGKTALRRFFTNGEDNLGEGFYTESFIR